MNTDLFEIVRVAAKAAKAILDVYNSSDFEVESKADNSPLTKADKRSHAIIFDELGSLYPDVPILSEEGRSIPFEERSRWNDFWLVDPLDGTKEFIKRNGEFTVNIARVREGVPVLGVVLVPVTGAVYFAAKENGAYRNVIAPGSSPGRDQFINSAQRLPVEEHTDSDRVRVVASRSHFSDDTREFTEKLTSEYGAIELVNAGSSLKFCLVAEGRADVYPRFAPTMEWDTAAGHCIAAESGCTVRRIDINAPLLYNKKELLNPWFIVGREPFTDLA